MHSIRTRFLGEPGSPARPKLESMRVLSMSTGSTVESQPGRAGGGRGLVRRPRCSVPLPLYHETQGAWGLGAGLGSGSGGGRGVGGLGLGQGSVPEGVRVLGRWPGIGGCGGSRGLGENKEGCVRQRSRNKGSPGHPEGHLNSPAKDPPLSVSEVASLSSRGLVGGHRVSRGLE